MEATINGRGRNNVDLQLEIGALAVYCGIDFGTTNSSAALSDGTNVEVVELDPANDSPASLPSLLYMQSDGMRIVGRNAAEAYVARHVGRQVKVEQVDLGLDIPGYVGAEPDKSETYKPPDDPRMTAHQAVRARATVEVDSPGRLFQSLKSSLHMPAYRGTELFGEHYQIEELTSYILRAIKKRLDEAAGHPVTKAVLGRPVRFSRRPEEDDLAERRLETAARLAGFEEVVFFYEPVAACVEYAINTEHEQRLMVVDIGGGTCDVCVMAFGGKRGAAARLAESQILGVAGVPVAGDAIDREIMEAKVFPLLGVRARYGPGKLPMPQHIFRSVADWQNLYKLNTEDTINWLIATEMSTDQPQAIRRLRTLIQKNYGYPLARNVEAAKKRLTTHETARIELNEEGLEIEADIERTEFAHIIDHSLEEMRRAIEEAEQAAGLSAEDIDLVLTTGGTSLVPAVRQMLEDRYGHDRLLQRDTFVSVAAGLAIVAQYV